MAGYSNSLRLASTGFLIHFLKLAACAVLRNKKGMHGETMHAQRQATDNYRIT